eukprot:NODE_449_length_7289_cov_1.146453.p2 type:complete len:475 gc:universal NODE_449_length_7289_cov_1.146453:3467-4891(+)
MERDFSTTEKPNSTKRVTFTDKDTEYSPKEPHGVVQEQSTQSQISDLTDQQSNFQSNEKNQSKPPSESDDSPPEHLLHIQKRLQQLQSNTAVTPITTLNNNKTQKYFLYILGANVLATDEIVSILQPTINKYNEQLQNNFKPTFNNEKCTKIRILHNEMNHFCGCYELIYQAPIILKQNLFQDFNNELKTAGKFFKLTITTSSRRSYIKQILKKNNSSQWIKKEIERLKVIYFATFDRIITSGITKGTMKNFSDFNEYGLLAFLRKFTLYAKLNTNIFPELEPRFNLLKSRILDKSKPIEHLTDKVATMFDDDDGYNSEQSMLSALSVINNEFDFQSEDEIPQDIDMNDNKEPKMIQNEATANENSSNLEHRQMTNQIDVTGKQIKNDTKPDIVSQTPNSGTSYTDKLKDNMCCVYFLYKEKMKVANFQPGDKLSSMKLDKKLAAFNERDHQLNPNHKLVDRETIVLKLIKNIK